jgi:hypothetical protein
MHTLSVHAYNEDSIASVNAYSQGTAKSIVNAGLKVLPALFTIGAVKRANAKAPSEADFINAVGTMIAAKQVITPTKRFVEVQAYDNARTNINYILKFLQLQKNVQILVQNSIDFSDDMDAIEAAQEAGNRFVLRV